jgi:hypothetical protein
MPWLYLCKAADPHGEKQAEAKALPKQKLDSEVKRIFGAGISSRPHFG